MHLVFFKKIYLFSFLDVNIHTIFKGAGGGGGLHQDFLEIDFLVVSDREE